MKKHFFKTLAFMFVFVFVFTACALPMNAVEYKTGDMNGDGKVNSDDAIYLLRHTLAPNTYPLACNHVLESHDAQEPSCEIAGWHKYETCYKCGLDTKVIRPALGHDYENGICKRCNPPDVWDGTVDTSWYNTSSTVFVINTAEQFAGIAELSKNGTTFEGVTIKLNASLDIGNYAWTPISEFYGTFDGQNFYIRNFKNSTGNKFAIFLSNYGEIKNLKIDQLAYDVSVNDADIYACGLVCKNRGSINNCHVSGYMSVYIEDPQRNFIYLSGLVMECYRGTISDCSADVDITVTIPEFLDSTKYPMINVGGFASEFDNLSTSTAPTVVNCHAAGDINISAGYVDYIECVVGGFLAQSYDYSVIDCYSTGDITVNLKSCSMFSAVGGFAGGIVGNANNCYSMGNVKNTVILQNSTNGQSGTSEFYTGGFMGLTKDAKISECYSEGDVIFTEAYAENVYPNYEKIPTVGGFIGTATGGFSLDSKTDTFVHLGEISNCYYKGTVTAVSPCVNAGGLVGYAEGIDISDCYSECALSANSDSACRTGGLVGYAKTQLEIFNGTVYTAGNITGCYTKGSVGGFGVTAWFGGLVGEAEGINISDCYSEVNMNTESYEGMVGGLAGSSVEFNDYDNTCESVFGSISNCHTSGNIQSNNSSTVGGIVGLSERTNISACYSECNITMKSGHCTVGGIVGVAYYNIVNYPQFAPGSISNCYFIGSINCQSSFSASTGGIAGECIEQGIVNCYSTGNIVTKVIQESQDIYDTPNGYAGGLVGLAENVTISDSYATGNVDFAITFLTSVPDDQFGNKKLYSAGGLVGYNVFYDPYTYEILESDENIANCYYSSSQVVKITKNGAIDNSAKTNYGISAAINTIKTKNFQQNMLKWSECYWKLADGTHPTLEVNHNIVYHEAQEATCLSFGRSAYETCSKCGYASSYSICKPLEHNLEDGICTMCGGDITWFDPSSKINVINSATQLVGLNILCNWYGEGFPDATIKLANNIDLGGIYWASLYNWNGIFDGQNYTISNFSIGDGFFYCNNGTVKNLSLNNFEIDPLYMEIIHGEIYTGMLACENHGTIDNCSVESSVSATITPKISDYGEPMMNRVIIGGLALYNGGDISSCETDVDIKVDGDVFFFTIGGLVAENSGNILYCNTKGDIDVKSESNSSNLYNPERCAVIGGLVGCNWGYTDESEIFGCYATGNINIEMNNTNDKGNEHPIAEAGGLVGSSSGTDINACYATGNVSVKINSELPNGNHFSVVGGLIGRLSSGKVSNCYASGNIISDITANSTGEINIQNVAGGLIGYTAQTDEWYVTSVSNSYASGNVVSSSVTTSTDINNIVESASGGLIGNAQSTVENCYATGNVSSTCTTPNAYTYPDVRDNTFHQIGGLVGTTAKYDYDTNQFVEDSSTIINCYRNSAQIFKLVTNGVTQNAASNSFGTAQTLTNLLKTTFHQNTLNWSVNCWEFTNGSYPKNFLANSSGKH